MSSPKLDKLDKPILLLDGGLGTTLEDLHAVRFSTETPLWSGHCLVADPATLERCQSSFAAVGADVVLTATYQASFAGFARTPRIHEDGVGYTEYEAKKFMQSAVPIARRALKEAGRDDGVVALSLGAFGATMTPSQEYTGAYPEKYAEWKGLYEFHIERIRVFIDDMKTWDDIDIVAFETLPVSREVRAVREVMSQLEKEGIQKRFWVSCVFPREDLRLPDGSSVEEVVQELLQP
jgi:homocysteine S-methyltransferase